MKPSIGRIVILHTAHGHMIAPGIICKVHNDTDTLDPSPEQRPVVDVVVTHSNQPRRNQDRTPCADVAASRTWLDVPLFETVEEARAKGCSTFVYVPPRT